VGDISFISIGAAGTFSGLNCTYAGAGSFQYRCSAIFTPTATDLIGYNGINLSFSGDTNYTGVVTNVGDNSGNYNWTITKQTMTFGAGSVTPSSVPYDSSTNGVVLSQVVNYTGSGNQPSTTGFTFTVNSVNYTASCTTAVSDSFTCSYTLPAATVNSLAVGSYPVTFNFPTAGNYNSFTGHSVGTLTITAANSTLGLAAGTPGTTTTGVTSTTFTATLSPAVAGSTVTFKDATTGITVGTGTTSSAGVATITVNTTDTGSGQTALPAGGLNLFSASATATSNTSAASTTSNSTVYFQGILFASAGAHNFTGLNTTVTPNVEGTFDGTTGAAYGVSIYNFTTSNQALPVTFVNAPSGAFTYSNSCGATLSPGEVCALVFNYAPPYGDGCALTGSSNVCTYDSAPSPGPYQQGTFESGTWSASLPTGVLAGLGNSGFTRSGAVTPSGIVEGKAILATGNALTVTPDSLTFGPQAPGGVSGTQNVTLSNSGAASLGITYTLPGGAFTTTNGCAATLAAGASCQIAISYTDANVATDTASLVITPATGSVITVALTGKTVANTGLSLTTNAHNFGAITEGSTSTFGMTVLNNSTTTTATSTFTPSGSSEFTISVDPSCSSLAPGASCQITVVFAPGSSTASVSGAVTITSNLQILPGGTGSGSSYSDVVNFTGSGTTSTSFTATSSVHNFGNTTVGSAATAYGTTLTNSTGVTLTLQFGSVSSPFTEITNCGATLAANASCQLQFGFTPTATGTVQQVFTISATNGSTTYPLYSGGTAAANGGITLTGTGQ
jgi:hypothetical protein